MRKTVLLSALLVLAGLSALLTWSERRPGALFLSDLRAQISSDLGQPSDAGNLLLIRPQLFPSDYQSPARLRLKLAAALDRARSAGLLTPRTLVALPEHIGTWLIASGEKPQLYRARDRYEVRDWLLLGNPLLATGQLLRHLDADRLDEALLRMKAERMARDYQRLFGGLARDYGVTLLAGSILLPSPQVRGGVLHSGNGPLRNLSLVFDPDGGIHGEPYSEAWPWQPGSSGLQHVDLGGRELVIARDWRDGYPRSVLQMAGARSAPLFLRGELSWPIGGAPRKVALTPEHAETSFSGPGSHLINLWLAPS
jgi:hypothetical protein